MFTQSNGLIFLGTFLYQITLFQVWRVKIMWTRILWVFHTFVTLTSDKKVRDRRNMQIGELEQEAFELNVSNANLMTENQLLMDRGS